MSDILGHRRNLEVQDRGRRLGDHISEPINSICLLYALLVVENEICAQSVPDEISIFYICITF